MLFKIEVGHDCLGAQFTSLSRFLPPRLSKRLRDQPLQFISDRPKPGVTAKLVGLPF